MLTQNQINQFKKNAQARGYSEIEIASEIARKNQQITRQGFGGGVSQQPQQNFQSTRPQNQQSFQPQPQPQTQPQEQGNFISKAADAAGSFLIPRIQKFGKTVAGTFNIAKETEALTKSNEELSKKSNSLIKQAKIERDPIKRKALLQQSRELSFLAQTNTENLSNKLDEFQQTSGIKDTDTNFGYAARQGIGVAGEAATWILPVNKLVQGAKLIKGASTIAKILNSPITRSVIAGTIEGGIYGLTTPEDVSLEERGMRGIEAGATGGVVSGSLTALATPFRKAVNSFVKSNKGRISKLFKVTPGERAKFRKATGNMNFEEEILARDGKELAGKSYDELLDYFTKKVEEAKTSKTKTLKGSNKTIDRKVIVDKIKSMINDLAPKKGNVGQKSVVDKLKEQLKDLLKNPKELTTEMVENIKTQFQNAGQSAYSPSGKATNTSKKLAELGTYVRELLEETVDGIGDKNKTIQLYQLAKKSIEKTGDRETKKVSKDLFQKFLQVIPAGIGVGAGLGGYAIGGTSGGALGLTLGLLVSGGAGASREKYLTPEVQTKLIKQIEEIATSQGIKNSFKLANTVLNATREVMTRKSSQMMADRPTKEQPGILDEMRSNPQTQENYPTEITSQQEEEEQDTGGVVTIRNKQTGEVKQVNKQELGQYGLGKEGGGATIPNDEDILVAMYVDMQETGGKNLSKLNTMLTAYNSVYDRKLKAEEKASETKDLTKAEKLENSFEGAIDQMKELYGNGKDSLSAGKTTTGIPGVAAKAQQQGKKAFNQDFQDKYNRYKQMTEQAVGIINQLRGAGVLNAGEFEQMMKNAPNENTSEKVAQAWFKDIKKLLGTNGFNVDQVDIQPQ